MPAQGSVTLQLEQCHITGTVTALGAPSVVTNAGLYFSDVTEEHEPQENLCQQVFDRPLAGDVAMQRNPITADLEIKPKQTQTHNNKLV